MNKKTIKLPDDILKKLNAMKAEANGIIKCADTIKKIKHIKTVSFEYKHSAPKDILTKAERAQHVCFITRYEHLPELDTLDIFEKNGKYFVRNIPFIRHVLNEYRSIISNEKDSIYYNKIHKFCHLCLSNRDPKKGLSIAVYDEKKKDVTNEFNKMLGEKNKSIRAVLNKGDFKYLYNGILQHSDYKYTERFWEEYYSGKLNYVFLMHAILLNYIKKCLYWHYTVLHQLTFPKLGPL